MQPNHGTIHVALPNAGQRQVAEHDCRRLLLILEELARGIEDWLGLVGLAEEQKARSGQAAVLAGREQVAGGIVRPDLDEVLLCGSEGLVAGGAVAEHRVGLTDVQHGQSGEDAAVVFGGGGRSMCERQSGLGVPDAVQGNVTLAQLGEGFADRVASLPRGGDGLVEEVIRGGVVATLGGIPDELSHQGG